MLLHSGKWRGRHQDDHHLEKTRRHLGCGHQLERGASFLKHSQELKTTENETRGHTTHPENTPKIQRMDKTRKS